MEIMRVDGKDLDSSSYAELRELVDTVGDVIHYFDSYKSHLFNMRKMIQDAKYLKRSVTYTRKKVSGVASIDELYMRTSVSMVRAFFSYTPFFWVTIVQIVARALAHTGVRLFGRAANQLSDFVIWSRPQVDPFFKRAIG